MSTLIIPAGTVCYVAGLPIKIMSDTMVEGEPEELAMLYSRLYPPADAGVSRGQDQTVPPSTTDGAPK